MSCTTWFLGISSLEGSARHWKEWEEFAPPSALEVVLVLPSGPGMRLCSLLEGLGWRVGVGEAAAGLEEMGGVLLPWCPPPGASLPRMRSPRLHPPPSPHPHPSLGPGNSLHHVALICFQVWAAVTELAVWASLGLRVCGQTWKYLPG